MKKLLLTTAIAGLAFAAAPAQAEGFDLKAGGFFKGYVNFVDQDEASGLETRDVDFLRHTEVYVTGETTLDNGLSVGVYIEGEADEDDSFDIEESYVYFQGDFGRINFGAEDGATYLLQVAAPAADENVDGVRQFISPVSVGSIFGGDLTAIGGGEAGVSFAAALINDEGGLDYDNDLSQEDQFKITYLTPVFSGFQAGISYTPEIDNGLEDGELTDGGFLGNGLDDQDGQFGDVVDLAARFEADFDGVGVQLGAGYSVASLEGDQADVNNTINQNGLDADDDRTQWNIAGNVNTAGFTVGVVYTEDDFGEGEFADEETFVVGASYETGAFKLGASFYDAENFGGVSNLDAQRYAGGVTYSYAPGLSFRGSIGYVEFENDGTAISEDFETTYVLLGTQVNF